MKILLKFPDFLNALIVIIYQEFPRFCN